MQLLLAFSALLLTVQLVAAVHSDQLQQPRFVKIKRAISTHDGDLEGQPNLERRTSGEETLLSGIKDIVTNFEEVGGRSEPHKQVISDLKELVNSHQATKHYVHPEPQLGSVQYHYYNPEGHPASIGEHYNLVPPSAGHGIAPQAWLADHEQMLGKHQQMLDTHLVGLLKQKEAIENNMADTAEQNERLKSVEKSQEKLRESKGGLSKSAKWALGTLGVATLTTTGTNIVNQHITNEHMADIVERMQAQQAEINRLKGLNGQQRATMPGQDAVATNGGGSSDGGVV